MVLEAGSGFLADCKKEYGGSGIWMDEDLNLEVLLL